MKVSHNPVKLAARIAVLLAAGAAPAGSHDVRARFTVSATVSAVARIESQTVPAELTISAADVARGFIAVTQPTTLVVRSNSASGICIDVLTVTALLTSITVQGFMDDQFLGGEGGTLVRRWQGPQALTVSLRFRLGLAPGLTPGRYPWPIRLTVHPLESA